MCQAPIEEGVGFPRTGATDSCELPYGLWELNPGPLEKQSVLLTAEHLPSPLKDSYYCVRSSSVDVPASHL